jgi:WD40 repeat protein
VPPTPTAFPVPLVSQNGKLLDLDNLPQLANAPASATEWYRFTAGAKAPFTALAYSPVHNTLAISTEMDIWLWDMTAGKHIQTINFRLTQLNDKDVVERGAASLSWSVDGKKLAAGSFRGAVYMWRWDTPTGKLRAGPTQFNAGPSQSFVFGSKVEVGFSPDGKLLATLGNDGIINVWDAETGALKADFSATFAAFFSWSPDKAMIVDDYLTVHHLEAQRNISIAPGAKAVVAGERPMGVAWSPDGKKIAVSGLDIQLGRVPAPPPHVENPNGYVDQKIEFTLNLGGLQPDPRQLTGRRVAFSPDSQYVAVANTPDTGKLTIWDYATGTSLVSLDAGQSLINALVWAHPAILITAGQDGTVRVWQLS